MRKYYVIFGNVRGNILPLKALYGMEAGNCPSTFSCAGHFVTGFEVLRSQHF
jgi:hypothetical protein